jgi:hypothetical protein
MNIFWFALLCASLSVVPQARRVPGYRISLGGDSLRTEIELPSNWGGNLFGGKVDAEALNSQVTMVDSAGNPMTYYPEDIKAFGFSFKKKDYYFVSKRASGSSSQFRLFVQSLVKGPRVNLFYYTVTTSEYVGYSYSRVVYNYIFERPEGRYLFLGDASASTYKDSLVIYFSDCPPCLGLVTKRFNTIFEISRDTKDVATDINNIK